METVCQLINQQEYRTALVRLWHLAQQSYSQGGTQLDEWSRKPSRMAVSDRIKAHFETGKELLELIDLLARPTDVIEALDRLLAAPKRKKIAVIPIAIESATYFLVQGSPHGGVEQTQAVRFGNYISHHQVIPEQLEKGVSARVHNLAEKAPTANAALKKQLKPKTATLCAALGYFMDQHQITWSTKETHHGREIGFATGTMGEKERFAEAQKQILAAEKRSVQLLIFPELTLSCAVQKDIADWLLERYETGNPCTIPLIVLGSFHLHCQSQPRNRCHLLQGTNGRSILVHDKFSPASIGGFTEDFTPGQFASLLQTPIGNLSMAICKDCVNDYKTIWLDQLCPDWLLIPSLSDKVHLHQQTTRELWNRHRCTSLVANQPIGASTLNMPASATAPHFGYIHASQSAAIDKLDDQAYHPGNSALWIFDVAIPAYKIKQC
ncbi:hypothetical protein VX159_06880 [Dechloromonas sp. ZY10]|uniref:hypothetical protein n=1 Tax=Dechloromonas aquae TaxID=2664436 RepID=UPI0035281816